MQERENETMKILLTDKENTNPQIAHLQFAQATAQTKNCKRAIFSNLQKKKEEVYKTKIKLYF